MRTSLRLLWPIATAIVGRPVEVIWRDDLAGLGWLGRASTHPAKGGSFLIELNRQALTDYKGLPNKQFCFTFWHEIGHCRLGHPEMVGETPANRLDTAQAVAMAAQGARIHDTGAPKHREKEDAADDFADQMIGQGYDLRWLTSRMIVR